MFCSVFIYRESLFCIIDALKKNFSINLENKKGLNITLNPFSILNPVAYTYSFFRSLMPFFIARNTRKIPYNINKIPNPMRIPFGRVSLKMSVINKVYAIAKYNTDIIHSKIYNPKFPL